MISHHQPMTPRDRILTTLRGEVPDRVPVSPFVQDEYLAFYYPHKTKVDRVIDATELANELDFDLMAKNRALEQPHFFRRSYPNWELRRSESRDAGMIKRRLEIVTPSRTLIQEETGPDSGAATTGVRFQVTRTLLQDADDAEVFLGYLPPLSDADRREMREIAATWLQIIGDRGVLAPWGFAGVFNFCADLCGMENFVYPAVNEQDTLGPGAIIQGDHKLVIREKKDGKSVELFDLKAEPAEKTNLFAQKPELARKLDTELRGWQISVLKSLTGADYRDRK